MSSNYPPGVSGNEYQIAGPDTSTTDLREVSCETEDCANYDNYHEVELDIESYGGIEYYTWVCPNCQTSRDYERELEELASDPDALHDDVWFDLG